MTQLSQAVAALKAQLKPAIQQQFQNFPEVQTHIKTLLSNAQSQSGEVFERAAQVICQKITQSPKFNEISTTNKGLADAIKTVATATPSQGSANQPYSKTGTYGTNKGSDTRSNPKKGGSNY